MGILNLLLAAGVSYIVLFGLKDREPPTVEILFPKDNYEFRTTKQIKVSAKDNKGIKVINYYIDDILFHEENSENPFSNSWNPCELRPGSHTLRVEAYDYKEHVTSTETITFSISPGLKSDCNGDCDGSARIDECGVCSDGETDHEFNSDMDCTDTCFGSAILDDCEICSGGNTGLTPNSNKDCEGVCFGNAYQDTCNICSGGTTNHLPDSDIDCNGDCFGNAKIDDCNICSGGNTGILNNENMDCTGLCFGDAFFDDCNICSEGSTGHIANSDKDCNGDCKGRAKIDECGACTGGKTGLKKNANMDCAGVCFGDAYINECMYCIGGTTGFKDTNNLEGDFSGAYGQDCNGDCKGKAIIDDCNICTEGKTDIRFNDAIDCNGDCNSTSPLWDGNLGGSAYLDDCGVCSEGNSNHSPNIDKDCNGDCFGAAIIDPCGGCTGGNTGIEDNQSLVNHGRKKYACGDLLFVSDIYSLKYPKDECSDSEIINNEEQLSKCIDKYLDFGETIWDTDYRLTQYTIPEQNIEGEFPKSGNYTTKLRYLDISKNLFWGSMPSNFCEIDKNGKVRLAKNRFCPPYPTCLNENIVISMDLQDMNENARCSK